MENKRG